MRPALPRCLSPRVSVTLAPLAQIWRKWHRKINIKQKRYAVCSALAASALPSLVMARGHKIDSVPEVPLVVSDAVESLSKTSAALALLRSVGAMPDAAKSKASKNLHKGKGKMRNRRYTQRRGPLVVYGNDLGICHAFRNIPGVELAHVERLNLLQLAPGGHMGRFCIWTKSAFAKLDSVFGTVNTESQQKKGFKVPRSMMANADLNRVINSDEIQSIVKAPKDHHARAALKKNPLKNLGAMLKLNPYAKVRLCPCVSGRARWRSALGVVDVLSFPIGMIGRPRAARMKRNKLLCMLRHALCCAAAARGATHERTVALTRSARPRRRSGACRSCRTLAAPRPRPRQSPPRAPPRPRASRRLARPSTAR